MNYDILEIAEFLKLNFPLFSSNLYYYELWYSFVSINLTEQCFLPYQNFLHFLLLL